MNSVISQFEIPVVQIDRAIASYELVVQISLCRENMDCAELAVFLHQDLVPGGALAKLDGITSLTQGAIIYLRTNNLAVTLGRVAAADGQCVFGPLELGQDIDTIALPTGSGGNRVGLHQPT